MSEQRTPRQTSVALLAAAFLAIAACGGGEKEATGPQMSKTPVSIRGWIADIEPPETELYRLRQASTGAAQARAELMQQTTFFVEGTSFASGSIAENGSFLILDVPHGDQTLTFTSPGIPEARLPMRNIPPNADVLLPGVRVTRTGVEITQPEKIRVRVPSRRGDPSTNPPPATIAGHQVAVEEVPLRQLVDRREYPEPQ